MKNRMFQPHILNRSVVVLMALLAQQQVLGSDASIYINPGETQATSTAMFLLDNSGSMVYDNSYDAVVNPDDNSIDVRLNRLKKTMQRVLVGDKSGSKLVPISGQDFKLGLSTFTSSTTGKIVAPALLSEGRAALPLATGALSATTLFPSSTTFTYMNPRDGSGTRNDGGALEYANIDTDTDRNWRVDVNDSAYLRFHIDIPRGASITSARLVLPRITGAANASGSAMRVQLEPVTNAAVMATNNTMPNRFTTAALVAGVNGNYVAPTFNNNGGLTAAGRMTFDFGTQLSSIVNNTAWCGMNAIALKLSATGTARYNFFIAGNRNERDQPRLEITWSMTDAVRKNTCMGVRTERLINSPAWTVNEDYITNIDNMTHRHYLNLEMQRVIGNTVTPTARAYAETVAYMMGNTTYNQTGNGFAGSTDAAKTVAGTAGKYVSPLPPNTGTGAPSASSCLSNGIFTLTDGQPNSNNNPNAISSIALKGATSAFCDDTNSAGWDCILKTAQALFPAGSNTAKDPRTTNTKTYPIRSVLVGFGDTAFWNGTSTDATNAKKWGSVDYGGGLKNPKTGVYETGYTSTTAKSETIAFIQRFFNEVVENLAVSSNGSGVAPGSYGTAGADQKYVYYPLFDPQIGVPFWEGNVKRYEVVTTGTTLREIKGKAVADANGTTRPNVLRGINQNTPASSVGSMFNPDTIDLWNPSTSVPDGGKILVGGLVSVMEEATVANRRLFVDVTTQGTTINNGALTQVGKDLDSAAQSTLMNSLTTQMAPVDPALSLLPTPAVLNAHQKVSFLKNYLWWLLNYDVKSLADGVTTTTATRTSAVKYRMGGVFHSQPEVITTKIVANKDSTGTKILSSSQTDYLIFGTMQGLVHVVAADTGAEQFVFAPSELLDDAKTVLPPSDQLVSGTTLVKAPLFYGMDGSWSAFVQRETVKTGNQEVTTASLIHAYGGMRMGGSTYYGLDLTGLGAGAITPKLLFKITPASTGFSKLGQTWSQPVSAYVRINGKRKRVIMFGGGYDANYESQTYVPGSAATGEKGAAVYIVDAVTGDLIASISNDATSGKNTQNTNIKYSIPSSMKVADRDADGTADHVYFGDLGGQLFRIDLNNAVGNKGSLVRRVVQLADFNATDTANGIRFYEPPSFAPSYDTLNKITTGLLAISSGNQSFPMGEGTQDYAYMLFDSDVMQSDLFSRTVEKTYTAKNMTNLVELTNNKAVTQISSQISPTGTKMGWYFKLPSYVASRLGAKGMVRTSIVDYVLNVTVFDPTRNNETCGAGIKGATTTYRMCLPYGACGTDATTYIAKNYLGGGIGKPLLTGSVHKSLSYANDTSVTDTTTPSGVGVALKDTYTFESKVKPMHRWREVTSEKYK